MRATSPRLPTLHAHKPFSRQRVPGIVLRGDLTPTASPTECSPAFCWEAAGTASWVPALSREALEGLGEGDLTGTSSPKMRARAS